MADIGDIVVTAHSDDADDDDGMVPASGATASGATASGATTSGATASGGASPPDAFENPFEGVDPAALAAMEAAAVKAAAVDEDEYIANDPRAQERAREASAMLQASLELGMPLDAAKIGNYASALCRSIMLPLCRLCCYYADYAPL